MYRSRKMVLAALVATLTILCGGISAEAKLIPKVTNFVILVDQSGSMFETLSGKQRAKATLAKTILRDLNERIPELEYQGALLVFAPDRTLIGPREYDRAFFDNAIQNLPETGKIYGNLTPLGPAFLYLDKVMNRFSGKTAVIVVSDGRANEGMAPLKAAKQIYAEYTNICFDIISLADNEAGRKTLKEIAEVSSCVYSEGTNLLADSSTVDRFVSDVFYLEVPDEAPLEEVVVLAEVITLRGVHFDFDKYEIKPEWASVLDEEAKKLVSSPDARIVIEGHTAMRFAWLKKNSDNYVSVKQGCGHPLALVRMAYNIAFWVFLLPFLTTMEYSTGFIVFTAIIFVRLGANLYANNVLKLTPEQFESFPFRLP